MKIEIPTMDAVLTNDDIRKLAELAKRPFPEGAPAISVKEFKNFMQTTMPKTNNAI